MIIDEIRNIITELYFSKNKYKTIKIKYTNKEDLAAACIYLESFGVSYLIHDDCIEFETAVFNHSNVKRLIPANFKVHQRIKFELDDILNLFPLNTPVEIYIKSAPGKFTGGRMGVCGNLKYNWDSNWKVISWTYFENILIIWCVLEDYRC